MAKDGVAVVARDIRALRIQGARKIAKAALKALMDAADASRAKNADEFYSDLLVASHELAQSRPTEPMMRNALQDSLRFALASMKAHNTAEVSQLKAALHTHQDKMLLDMDLAAGRIAQYGAQQIGQGANVLVHCHSSTLVGMLIMAYEEGRNPHVTCLETRPLFQGRLTARELANAGIDTTLAVDSATGSLMNRMDLVVVGADAITAGGDLVNKVGTHTLAQLAQLHCVKFICAAELYKYDPLTRFGKIEQIEERDAHEVWGDGRYAKEALGLDGLVLKNGASLMRNSNGKCSAKTAKNGRNAKAGGLRIPPRLSILNPAFDLTPAKLVSAYITEEGVVPPAQIGIIAERRMRNGRANG